MNKKLKFHSKKNLLNSIGNESNIYLIKGFAAKIKKQDGVNLLFKEELSLVYDEDFARNEFEIANDLYLEGVNVPKPKGVYSVQDEKGEIYSAFFMDYLKNYFDQHEIYRNFGKNDFFWRVEELRSKEKVKVKALGYMPTDFQWWGNALYSIKKDDLKLIDFSRWRKN